MGWGDLVLAFGGPLAFFAVAPEDEDDGDDAREEDCKPCSMRHFGQCRGHVDCVECAEDKEESDDHEDVPSPFYNCDKADENGRDESNHDHADSIGVTEAGCLYR